MAATRARAIDSLWSCDPRALYQNNVEGTENMLAAAAAAKVERFVHTSSVGALGLRPDGTRRRRWEKAI